MGKHHLKTLVLSPDVLTFTPSVKRGVSVKHLARFYRFLTRPVIFRQQGSPRPR